MFRWFTWYRAMHGFGYAALVLYVLDLYMMFTWHLLTALLLTGLTFICIGGLGISLYSCLVLDAMQPPQETPRTYQE